MARLRELRPEALSSRLEISTVDGFQGREKEAIVISMVRGVGQTIALSCHLKRAPQGWGKEAVAISMLSMDGRAGLL